MDITIDDSSFCDQEIYKIIPDESWCSKGLLFCIDNNSWYLNNKFYAQSVPGESNYKAQCIENGFIFKLVN